jgi:tRNA (adenine57-N1/adenine58-N1)-methyltransferase catalytic subunit
VILLVGEGREYLREPGTTLETDLGILEIPEEPMPGETLETHLGTAFRVRKLRGPDFARHFERTGAPMLPRDIGLVMGHTGVSAGDQVLDAGTGTGVLAASLGRAGASVLTYERDVQAASVARENMALAGVEDRIEVKTGNVLRAIERWFADTAWSGTRFDLVTLDTADAPAVLEHAPQLLVHGGFCAVYSPFVEAARAVVEAARDVGLTVETYETIQRELDVDERGTRPTTTGVGHTGFLTICRRE